MCDVIVCLTGGGPQAFRAEEVRKKEAADAILRRLNTRIKQADNESDVRKHTSNSETGKFSVCCSYYGTQYHEVSSLYGCNSGTLSNIGMSSDK